MKAYVLASKEGYIENWSEVEIQGWELVETNKELFGLLSCVRIQAGVLTLDEEKQKQLSESIPRLSEIEWLKQENDELKKNQEVQNEAIAELGEMLAGMAGE